MFCERRGTLSPSPYARVSTVCLRYSPDLAISRINSSLVVLMTLRIGGHYGIGLLRLMSTNSVTINYTNTRTTLWCHELSSLTSLRCAALHQL